MEMLTGDELWDKHPSVRTGEQLTFGERAADVLKKWFGTWTALGSVTLLVVVWILFQHTSFKWDIYPFILLNLLLSMIAAVQGIILQISANRGDRVSGEVALHTANTADDIILMQKEMLTILKSLEHVNDELDLIKVVLGVTDDGRTRPESHSFVPDSLPGTPAEEE
jgi:uncharacterized membrane protein